MIKNKELQKIIEQKKDEVSCKNCAYCHQGAFHSGKWYCKKTSVFTLPVDIEKCFERKQV